MDILSRMKITCLERWRDEAKKKYRTFKKEYVDKSLGRPMEKLSVSYRHTCTHTLTPSHSL